MTANFENDAKLCEVIQKLLYVVGDEVEDGEVDRVRMMLSAIKNLVDLRETLLPTLAAEPKRQPRKV